MSSFAFSQSISIDKNSVNKENLGLRIKCERTYIIVFCQEGKETVY